MHDRGDRRPSLTVNPRPGIGAWVFCHAAGRDGTEDVMKALGMTMADLYDNPSRPAGTTDRDRARERLEAARAHTWTGRNRLRDRDAYLAIAKRAVAAGTLTVDMSQRHLAELTGTGDKAARDAMNSLVDQGLIVLGPHPANRTHARSVTLKTPGENAPHRGHSYIDISTGYVTNVGHSPHPPQIIDPGSDLGVVLGKTGQAVYAVLTSEVTTISAIARAARVSRKTARDRLGQLERLRLATRCGWVRGPRDLAAEPYDPATESECGSVATRRKDRHVHEREQYHELLARREERREQERTPVVCAQSAHDLTSNFSATAKISKSRHKVDDYRAIAAWYKPVDWYAAFAERDAEQRSEPLRGCDWCQQEKAVVRVRTRDLYHHPDGRQMEHVWITGYCAGCDAKRGKRPGEMVEPIT